MFSEDTRTGRRIMGGVLAAVTTATALGAAAMGGVFLAFSAFVMPALRDLPGREGAEAMRAINRRAVRPPLMTPLLGTATACAALGVVAVVDPGEPYAWRLLAGGAIYLVGVIGVTGAFHVPRNDALEAASGDRVAEVWRAGAPA